MGEELKELCSGTKELPSAAADRFRGLGNGQREATPDHSSLRVIRYRLSPEQLHAINLLRLRELRAQRFLDAARWGSTRW